MYLLFGILCFILEKGTLLLSNYPIQDYHEVGV